MFQIHRCKRLRQSRRKRKHATAWLRMSGFAFGIQGFGPDFVRPTRGDGSGNIYAAFFSPGAFASGWPRLAAARSICELISPPTRKAKPVMYSHINRMIAAPNEP